MRVTWIVFLVGCGFQSPSATSDGADGTGDSPEAADAGFDHALCPASYDVVSLPGPSRYRLLRDGHRAWEQSDTCHQDLPGATHLVVIETPQELAVIASFVRNPGVGIAGNALWIGGVQPRTATSPRDGWLGFDGNALIDGWGGVEPNDRRSDESNHEEQFVKMQQDKPYFIDTSGMDSISALCECDGKPTAGNAANAIVASRSAIRAGLLPSE